MIVICIISNMTLATPRDRTDFIIAGLVWDSSNRNLYYSSISHLALHCNDLKTYKHIMNKLVINNFGRFFVVLRFSIYVIWYKPILFLDILKYWFLRKFIL